MTEIPGPNIIVAEILNQARIRGIVGAKVAQYAACSAGYDAPKITLINPNNSVITFIYGDNTLVTAEVKDGVVYETFPNGTPPIICIKSRTHEKDMPCELEHGGEHWKEIKMPIIADEVNEDWLEKKMLCFVRRQFSGFATFTKVEDVKCDSKDCDTCFPEDKQEGTIPAESVIAYICIHGTHPCEECKQKHEDENRPKQPPESAPEKCRKCGLSMYACNEVKLSCPPQVGYRCAACDDVQPREKVTVEEMYNLLRKIRGIEYGRGALRQGRLNADEMGCLAIFEDKLEYLVSLQEK